MTIYDLKPRFQDLLRPSVRRLAAWGATPNQVTVVAMVLSGLAGALIVVTSGARWALVLIPVLALCRMALNAIDGMLAREHGMMTNLGAFLNELGDVISDAVLYLPLAVVPGVRGLLVVPAVYLAVMCEMTGTVATQVGASRRYDGPMGKSDRAFAFSLMALFLGIGIEPGLWCDLFLIVILVLQVRTIRNRVRGALDEVINA